MSNCTVPLPVPLAPEVMVIHASLLAAVHVQPLAVDTLTVPTLELPGAFCLVGAIEYVQVAATAACVTLNV